jgi:dTMP kinase
MGLFITFEGGEGSGKSTQAKALYRRLIREDIPSLLVREPGGTPFGEKVRRVLKQSHHTSISPLAELLLFNASRCQLVKDSIQPALAAGKVVVCDRYADSTVAYQHYGRGLDMETVRQVNATGTLGLKPDLTFLLDIPAETGLVRKTDGATDRFMQEDLPFHTRVRQGFIELACEDPKRWLMLDATASASQINDLVWERVSISLGLKKALDRAALTKHIHYPTLPTKE